MTEIIQAFQVPALELNLPLASAADSASLPLLTLYLASLGPAHAPPTPASGRGQKVCPPAEPNRLDVCSREAECWIRQSTWQRCLGEAAG